MPARNLRREIATALDRAKARWAFRFPKQKSGTLVVDLDPAPANLALVQRTLAAMPAPWPRFAAWLAAPDRAPQHADGQVLLATALAPAAAQPERADEAALLAAIAEAPDDDAPRLVYADLLTARGDPHGELIVLQCRLARGDGDERMAARVTALLDAGWKAYAGELAPYAFARAFERGFVREAVMTIAAFTKHGERVFTAFPTHTLHVANDRLTVRDLGRLAKVPALAHVRGLIVKQRYDAAERIPLAELATSPHLHRLELLELNYGGVSAADWTRLFATLDAPALSAVHLVACHASAAIPRAIASNPRLQRLRRFVDDAREQLDGGDTREAYAQLASRVELHHLSIASNRFVDDDAIAAFFAPDAASALRTLRLASTGVTDRLLHAIAASPKAAMLERLDVGGVTRDGVRVLLASPHVTRLAHLDAGLPDAEHDALVRALPASHPLRT